MKSTKLNHVIKALNNHIFLGILLISLCFCQSVFAQDNSEKDDSYNELNITEKGDTLEMSVKNKKNKTKKLTIILGDDDEDNNIEITTKDSGSDDDDIEERTIVIDINEGDMKKEIKEEIKEEIKNSIKRPKKKLKNIDTRWFMVDLGLSGLLYDGGLDFTGNAEKIDLDHGKSVEWTLHIIRQRVNLIKHHVNLMYGISASWNNYHFDGDYTLLDDAAMVTPTLLPNLETTEYKKNKFSTTTLYVPVLLNFETNPYKKRKSFRVNVGGYGGLVTRAKAKQKTDDGDKFKVKDDFNTNKLVYGLMGQIGIGSVNLYAKYNLTELFDKDERSPEFELYPVSVGISLLYF